MNTISIKALVITLFLFILPFAGKSQGSPIAEGALQGNLGAGLSSRGLPFYGALDYGVHQNVTVGGQLEYRVYNDRFAGIRYNHQIFGLSGNVNFHFNHLLELPEQWNVYGGANLGFYLWDSPGSYSGSGAGGLGIGLQLGGRYYFNERWGANLELGGTQLFGGGKIGASYRF